MKKAIDLIMFDLDGTLADTGRDLADAVNHTRAHFDLPALADSLVHANVGRGVEHLLRQSLPKESSEHFQEVMEVFLARYENHLLDATVLYPDVRKTLNYFCRQKESRCKQQGASPHGKRATRVGCGNRVRPYFGWR